MGWVGSHEMDPGQLCRAAAAGESILRQHFRRVVSRSPCRQVCSPELLPRLLLTQSDAFQLRNNHPPKSPFPWGSGPHLTDGSLVPAASTTKRQFDRFIRVCTTHSCDRQTDRPRYTCSNEPHLTNTQTSNWHNDSATRLVCCCQPSLGLAEWLACLTQAQKGLGSNRSRDAVG